MKILSFFSSRKSGKNNNRTMREELELQLHEQYAVNNNANLGSIISLVVGVIAVLWAFGYVYLYSSLDKAASLGSLVSSGEKYSLDALIMTADAAIFVLAILFLICLNRGAYQRKEQFIIHTIRWQYFQEFNKGKDLEQPKKLAKIFPKGYNPYGKNKCDFVQDVFWLMMVTFVVLTVIILVLTTSKIANQVDRTIGLIIISVILVMLLAFCCWQKWQKAFEKYKELEKEYEEYKPEE